MHYYMKLLDIEHHGYLDAYAINFFWKGIQVLRLGIVAGHSATHLRNTRAP